MPVDTDAPPTKEETKFRESGLNKWMQGLHEQLPNPSIAAGNPEAQPAAAAPAPAPPPTAPATPADPVPPAPAPAAPPVPPAPPPPAPPAAPPAPAEPAAVTDETRWPRSAKEWKNFTEKQKARNEAYEKQITDQTTKIKELEAKATGAVSPEVQKEIDSLKKENEEFSKQLRLVAVTNHPRFKSYFETKTNNVLNILKSCVPADQIGAVTSLIQQPDSESKNEQINEMLDNMSRLQQSRFLGVINSLAEIQAEKDAEVSRANTDYDQMVAQGKAQQEQQKAAFGKMLDDTVKGMQDVKTGRPEYQLREGQTEWNASVQKRIDAGRALITGNLSPEVMFKAAFDAAAYGDVLVGYKTALGEIDKLQKQIAAMSASNPKVETKPTAGTGSSPAMPKDSRPMDYTKRWVDSFGKAMRGEQM